MLAFAAGETNQVVSQRHGVTAATVGKWRRRLQGLYDEWRPGKPRSIDDGAVAALLNTTPQGRPRDGATH